MHHQRRLRRIRPLVAALAASATVLLVPAVASAEDEGAGDETVVGELVQAWAEPETDSEATDEVHAEPLSWIETDSGEAVRVPTEQVEDLPVGATVEVTVGDEVADEASRETGLEAAREVLATEVLAAGSDDGTATAPAGSPLTNQVTVVMVTPAGGIRDSRTLAQVVDAVNGPVASFWSEESQGAIKVGVTAAHDWRTTVAACSDPTGLWNEVAGQVGFTSGPGKHLLVYVTSAPSGLSGCSYGLAQVGSGPTSGGRMYVRDTMTSLIAHELGHNFRLGHSSGRQCDGAVETGTCRTQEYRDFYDVMGSSWGRVGSLNAAQAQLLGVLPSPQRLTVQASGAGGVFTLAPFSGRAGVRTIRLVDAEGVDYWVEYRTATGRDDWLGSAGTNPYGLQPGVLLRRGGPSPDTSLLLDATPSRQSDWNADRQTALAPGGAVRLSGGDFTVSVLSASASGAVLQVSTGGDADLAASATRLARTRDDATVYVVSGSNKYWISNMATLEALSPLGPVTVVPQSFLDRRTTVSGMSRIVMAPSGTAYFVDAGIKLPFPSCELVVEFGGTCAGAVRLEQPLIDALHSGPPITQLYRTTSGKAFFVAGGAKREVFDDTALALAGLPSGAVTLLETGLASLPYGMPITRDGVVLRNRQNGTMTVSAGGQFTTVSEGVRSATALASLPVRSLDDAGLRLLPTSAVLGPLVSEGPGGRAFLLTEQGKRHVTDPSMLPASLPVMPPAVLGLVPDGPTLDAGVFLKGSTHGSIYTLRAGQLRGIRSWADLIALNGGSPALAIATVEQRLVDLLPLGPIQLGPGTLVVSPRDATVYFVNGVAELVPVTSFAVTNELGAGRLAWIGDAELGAYTVRAGAISPAIDCAGTRYLGLGGKLYRVGPDAAAHYSLGFTPVDPVACGALTKAAGDLTRFLRGGDGSIYLVESGVKRPIASLATYVARGGTAANTIQTSNFGLSLVPTGAVV
jgi:hypothetical protein